MNLNSETQKKTFRESKFQHDFSSVPLHTGIPSIIQRQQAEGLVAEEGNQTQELSSQETQSPKNQPEKTPEVRTKDVMQQTLDVALQETENALQNSETDQETFAESISQIKMKHQLSELTVQDLENEDDKSVEDLEDVQDVGYKITASINPSKAKKVKVKRTLLDSRKKDMNAAEVVKIFILNKNNANVVAIKLLSKLQKKIFKKIKVSAAKLSLSLRREYNGELDRIQTEILSNIKQITKNDAPRQELITWYDNNNSDSAIASKLHNTIFNMFGDKPTTIPFNKTPSKEDYHRGTKTDPIPIVWYKPMSAYKSITPTTAAAKNGLASLAFPGGGNINGLTFGVDLNNLPTNWTKANPIEKVAHESDRGVQKGLNKHLSENGYKIGDDYQLDGDHVKDLGFNGDDEIKNYWPLNSGINRRGFQGYNSRYILNYYEVDLKGNEVPKAKSIGGMIGKYFYVKGYMSSGEGTYPAESGTSKAGTTQT